jgi:hypothetical protein
MNTMDYGLKMSLVKFDKIPQVVETLIFEPRKGSKWFKHLNDRKYVVDVKLSNTCHHFQHRGWMHFTPKDGGGSALRHGNAENPPNPELLTKTRARSLSGLQQEYMWPY